MLAGVLVGGTLGYVLIEDWPAWDALYMTVTTVATVGYRGRMVELFRALAVWSK